MRMTLSEELQWRGFINQTTLTDLSVLDQQAWTFYHGYDASADSQTVGNLAAMMLDRAFMRHGHQAIILAGGATSLIGDPGGKDKERPLQSAETIAHNVSRAQEQLQKIFGQYNFKLVNNLDWTRDLNVIEYLRDYGKYFSMTPLVQRDYIATRMGPAGEGISYAEFSYTVLQGIDYLHLFDAEGCRLQLGGSDQWGNCLSGVELIRRARGQETHVITQPLVINKATGKKFGKSETGAVWLDATKTTPTQFYQFWINADDAGVEDYLKIYTELDKSTIDQLMEGHRQDPGQRRAQQQLALTVTSLVHGEDAAVTAQAVTDVLVGRSPIDQLNEAALTSIRQEVPTVSVSSTTSVIEALVQSGLAVSNSEARRLLQANAITLNGHKIQRDNFEDGDFINGRLLMRRGKAFKDSALVELS